MIENFSLALKLSLLSGIISPILYICIDIIGILSWKGYNYVSQSISDLPGIGSPIRNIMVPLYVICYIFLLFFGLGVFFIDSESRYLQLIGSLITLNAIFSVGGLIFAKYLAEAINSTNNKKNTLVMFFAVLFLVIGIIISIFAFENWLKYGALAIIVLFTVLTIVGLTIVPTLFPNKVFSGLQERTMAYCFNVWLFLLAINLLENQKYF